MECLEGATEVFLELRGYFGCAFDRATDSERQHQVDFEHRLAVIDSLMSLKSYKIDLYMKIQYGNILYVSGQ